MSSEFRYSQTYFEGLDTDDPLKFARDDFHIPDDLIYFDGNSLGPMLKDIPARINEFLTQEWAEDLIASWNKHDWFASPFRLGQKLAPMIGAKDNEVVVTDIVSINLFKLIIAALRLRPERRKIVSEQGNFPTDLYVIDGAIKVLGQEHFLHAVENRSDILDAIDDETALVLLTDVHYKTGHRLDMKAITEKAHHHGAVVIWDLCHSAGVLPVKLDHIQADFAVGCGYKYLNGGPGAPAFLYIAERHHGAIDQPITGWWSHAAPFEFSDDFIGMSGIGRSLTGTQSILALRCFEIAIDHRLHFNINEIREKSIQLCDAFIGVIEQECADFDFKLITPRAAEWRGSQVAFEHDNAFPIVQALIDQGVVGDFRHPNVLRFGFNPLYNRFSDIWRAGEILSHIMRNETWRAPHFNQRRAVT